MEKRSLFILITNFQPVEDKLSYVEKEIYEKKELDQKQFRVRFFHQKFQSKRSLLKNILQEIDEREIHIVFKKEVSRKKMDKIIQFIKNSVDELKFENIVFYTVLN